MCGICGIFHFSGEPVAPPVLERMTAALTHRGPDEDGYFLRDGIGLGHRRLDIIDLSTGRQPIFNEDGRFALILNGEIYNYLELRKRLIDRGHVFKTKTDTEVIVHLYEEEGEGCLDRLRGMFSFALWDGEKRELFFARDRLGKKPFYYYRDDRRFLFASEIKAILRHDLDLHLNKDAVLDFFKYQFIPSPRTAFREIEKLPPGHYGKVGPRSFRIHRYWDIPVKEDAFRGRSFASIEEELDARLTESTKIRLMSDVPLGAFLSGGLDSSLIAALIKKDSNADLKTFSIGFKEKSYDESPFAARVARALGTTHKNYDVEYRVPDLLERLVNHFDEPFGDSSAIPTYYLSKYTRENVTVALSGDGGDELFGGYRRYLANKLGRRYLKIPRAVRRAGFEQIIDRLPVKPGYYGKSVPKKMKLFVAAARKIESGRFFLAQIFGDGELRSLFRSDSSGFRSHVHDDLLDSEFQKTAAFDDLTRMMWFDLHYYLPDDILVKVDRMSMLNSLEVRAPYLDHTLVEYAFNLPLEYKIRGNTTKYILKKIGQKYIPADIIARPKQGFMVPLDVWFKSELRPLFREKVIEGGLFDRRAVEAIERDHLANRADNSTKMWLLLVFAMFTAAHRLS